MTQQPLLAFHKKKLIEVIMLEKGPVMVQYHFYSFKMVTEKCNIAGVGLNPRNVHLKLVSTSRQ